MIIFERASPMDGGRDHALGGMSVLPEGETIREVSGNPVRLHPTPSGRDIDPEARHIARPSQQMRECHDAVG